MERRGATVAVAEMVDVTDAPGSLLTASLAGFFAPRTDSARILNFRRV